MLVTGIGGLIASGVFTPPPYLFSKPTVLAAFIPLISGGVIAMTAREKQPAARVAAMILGIFGGICSSFVTFGLIIGAIGAAMLGRFEIWGLYSLYSLWGFLCSLMAIAGVISLDRPTRAGILMLLSAIGGGVLAFTIIATMRPCLPSLEVFYLVATFVLIPGGVCALVSRTVKGPAWIIAATIIFLGIGGGLLATVGPWGILYYPFGSVLFLLIVGGALALAARKKRP
jgi:hypothetical protein